MKLKLHAMAAIALSIAGSSALIQSAQAQFTDQDCDLILTFRKTGFDGVGTASTLVFEVDLGQASIYYGATPGSVIPITAYNNNTQLGTLFDSIDDLSWSVGSCVPDQGNASNPTKPARTLWVTAPRSNPGTQAKPWVCQGFYGQGDSVSEIEQVVYGAGFWARSLPADSVTNTPTSLVIPTSSSYSAADCLGAIGNYLGTFQGDVENTTPSTFIYGSSPSCSDLYELQYANDGQAGTYLGYFQLNTDGSMTFYAPSAVVTYPAPTLSVSSSAGSVTISFQSTLGGTYTLYSTGAGNLTTPFKTTSWTQVTSMTGDGNVDLFPQQPISGTGTIYAVTVH